MSGPICAPGRDCYLRTTDSVGVVESAGEGGMLTVSVAGRSVTLPAAEVVVLPRPGESVALVRPGGRPRGYWIGVVPPASSPEPTPGRLTVRLLVGAHGVFEYAGAAADLGAESIVTGTAEPGLAAVLAAVAHAYAVLDATTAAHTGWKVDLGAAAGDRADEQGWCAEFDRFMADWGLPGRPRFAERDFDVEVTVTGRVSIRVEATSAAEAEESVSRTEILTALTDLDCLDHLDFEIGDATEA